MKAMNFPIAQTKAAQTVSPLLVTDLSGDFGVGAFGAQARVAHVVRMRSACPIPWPSILEQPALAAAQPQCAFAQVACAIPGNGGHFPALFAGVINGVIRTWRQLWQGINGFFQASRIRWRRCAFLNFHYFSAGPVALEYSHPRGHLSGARDPVCSNDASIRSRRCHPGMDRQRPFQGHGRGPYGGCSGQYGWQAMSQRAGH